MARRVSRSSLPSLAVLLAPILMTCVVFIATTATATPKYGSVPDGELVTFYDGDSLLGWAAMVGGVASYATSSLSPKTHSIRATYAGCGQFL